MNRQEREERGRSKQKNEIGTYIVVLTDNKDFSNI